MNELIDQIIENMINNNELSFGNISNNERENIIQNIHTYLSTKSIDELNDLLNKYHDKSIIRNKKLL